MHVLKLGLFQQMLALARKNIDITLQSRGYTRQLTHRSLRSGLADMYIGKVADSVKWRTDHAEMHSL